MKIYLYLKSTEEITVFDEVIKILNLNTDDIYISVENKRSFRNLEDIKDHLKGDDITMISSISSLGLSDEDIKNQLTFFAENKLVLIICNMESTYQYGLTQPLNQAILNTISISLSSKNKVVTINKKSNVGRNKIEFPSDWEELYEQWDNKAISSKQFIERSGLKKATFYNMLSKYQEIQKINREYQSKFKAV